MAASPTKVIVEVPRDENLRLGRVGVVAALGFAVGVVWPTLAGVRLVPTPPGAAEAAPVSEGPASAPEPAGGASALAAPTPPGPVVAPTGAQSSAAVETKKPVKVENATDTVISERLIPLNQSSTVVWELVLVRATPARQGATLDRLMQGSKVTVTARQGDWCRIKYGPKGKTGWVFRSSVGI